MLKEGPQRVLKNWLYGSLLLLWRQYFTEMGSLILSLHLGLHPIWSHLIWFTVTWRHHRKYTCFLPTHFDPEPSITSFFFLVNDLWISISTHFTSSNNKPHLHYPIVSKMCFITVYLNLNLTQDYVIICLWCPISLFASTPFFMIQICRRDWASCPASDVFYFLFFFKFGNDPEFTGKLLCKWLVILF